MKKYSKYKPSNIEWIGDIPEHWEIKVLKRLAKICNGQDHKKVWDANGQFPIIGTGGTFGYTDSYLHEGPSVILGRKGTIDKPQYMEAPFWSVDTAYYTEIFPSTNPRYFYYLCTTINFELYKYGSAVPSMSQEVLNQIPFSVTNALEEQMEIANYLDRKTQEIDQLIEAKKQLIQLFEEEKTTIISQLITKGLDSNIEMVDSGVEWIGKIPKHWSTTSLKWVSKIYSGGTPSKSNPSFWNNGTIPWLNSGTVNQFFIKEASEYITEEGFKGSSAKWIPAESIVIALAGQGKTKGMVAQVTFDCTCNQSLGIILPNEKIDNKFLLYYLKINYQNIRNLGGGDKRDGINLEMVGSIKIPLLQLEEQINIVSFIEKHSKLIDSKIKRTKKLINLLTEYRSALISEVVTGKVKVID
ncbi:restriction endonuclease subunit S [Flavobacterium rivuli]|uniref:restriction endonuclease subunit S n=1 Tax=Flavobacterium rivuli TaxID=498301 RepID=UPI0003683530|nr:restriction endonuclease subunit S [Flavobacterium rivuli]